MGTLRAWLPKAVSGALVLAAWTSAAGQAAVQPAEQATTQEIADLIRVLAHSPILYVRYPWEPVLAARAATHAVPPTPSEQAASALVRIGAAAVEPLIATLADERPVLRGNAACVLGWIGDVRAAGPVSALVKDADPYVRVCAATALGGIADPATVDGLIAALGDEDEDTRMMAAMGLGRKKNERAVDVLLEAFDRAFPATAYALGETRSPRAVDRLISRLEDPHAIVVIQALAKIGDRRAVEPLIPLLKARENWQIAYHAAMALGALKDPRAVEPLIGLLADPQTGYARTGAAWALGEIGDAQAALPLIAALKDKEAPVRQAAALALGRIKDPRAVESLLAAMKAGGRYLSDEKARQAAVQALGEIGDARAVAPLVTLLKDRKIRGAVAEALGKLGDPRAVRPLIECLKDENRWCDSPIALALKRIAAPDTVERLVRALDSRDVNWQRGATVALGAVGAVEPLTEALKKPDAEVRRLAAVVLMHLKDPRTLNALIDALKDESEAVRLYAAEALKAITGQDFGQDHARWAAWREGGQTPPAP